MSIKGARLFNYRPRELRATGAATGAPKIEFAELFSLSSLQANRPIVRLFIKFNCFLQF